MSGARLRFVVLLTALLGCATLEPIPPHQSVDLAPDEGIVVMDVDTQVPLLDLQLEDRRVGSKIEAGRHLFLARVPAGRYRWHGLTEMWLGRRNRIRFPSDEDQWRFRVEPGTVSYPGRLIIRGSGLFGVESSRVVNRSAMLLTDLLEQHPELLERYRTVYTGYIRDDFLEHYFEAEARERSGK